MFLKWQWDFFNEYFVPSSSKNKFGNDSQFNCWIYSNLTWSLCDLKWVSCHGSKEICDMYQVRQLRNRITFIFRNSIFSACNYFCNFNTILECVTKCYPSKMAAAKTWIFNDLELKYCKSYWLLMLFIMIFLIF